MSDLMRKRKCRHGLIDPDLDIHQEHPEWAACMGFGLVPVEPVDVVEMADHIDGWFTVSNVYAPDLPKASYRVAIVIVEVDDE